MWIKALPQFFWRYRSFDSNIVFLWKSEHAPIYVMDNHLCAAWCWMQECNPNEDYNFMHVDRHADLGDNYGDNIIDFLRSNHRITFEKYRQLSFEQEKTNRKCFRYDNYIRAAHFLFPNWFNTNLFYTQEFNDCYDDKGNVLIKTETREIENLSEEITKNVGRNNCTQKHGFSKEDIAQHKWIVNIDLDFVWSEDGTKVIDDDNIRDIAQRIENVMPNIQVLNIALSPDFIGGFSMKEKWINVINVLKIFKQEISGLKELPEDLFYINP